MKKIYTLLISLILLGFNSHAQDCFMKPAPNYYVTSTNDMGPGSFREVINQINMSGMEANIMFAMGGSTISLMQPLPEITVPVFIDGMGVTLNGNFMIQEPAVLMTAANSCLINLNFVNFLPPDLTVTNINDDGAGSLRRVIQILNATSNGGMITFNIPGTAPHTITPFTALPAITKPVEINASSQPENGYTGTEPKIHLNGALVASADGLTFSDLSSLQVYGLKVTGFKKGLYISMNSLSSTRTVTIGSSWGKNVFCGNSEEGIYCAYSLNGTFEYNYFGLDPATNDAQGNGTGLLLIHDENSIVRNNVLSGNSRYGLYLQYSKNALVNDNYIGTDMTATANRGNAEDGIMTLSLDNAMIRNNVISGNGTQGGHLTAGIELSGKASVRNNKIGTDITGTVAIPNDLGIYIEGGVAEIGGPSSLDGNLISGNTDYAVYPRNMDTLIVMNNKIGTNAAGNARLGNLDGIYGRDVHFGLVSNNLISGNKGMGVYIFSAFSVIDSFTVRDNYIGVNADLTDTLGNGVGVGFHNVTAPGVYILNNIIGGNKTGLSLMGENALVKSNFIGFNPAGTVELPNATGIRITGSENIVQENVIAHNEASIILATSSTGTLYNRISRNSMYNNGGPGIDLDPVYTSANGLPHDSILPPVIVSVSTTGLSGIAEPGAEVEVYLNHTYNQYLQGETWLGTAIADVDGNWTLSSDFSNPCQLTALTIDTENNTSLFSAYQLDVSINEGAEEVWYCVDSIITLQVNVDYPALTWSNGEAGVEVIATAPGKYWVDASDVCGGFDSDTIVVVDKEEPVVAGIDFTPVDLTVQFSNLSTGATSYVWHFGDNNTSAEFEPSHTYAEPGSYTVALIGRNYCVIDTTELTIQVGTVTATTAYTEKSMSFSYGEGELLIRSEGNVTGTLQLTDLSGRTHLTQIRLNAGVNQVPLNLPSGLYLVTMITEGQKLLHSGKVVVR